MAKVIDTNLLIRYFLNDIPKKAQAVENLLLHSDETVIVPDMVIAELVWVLKSFYKKTKEEIVAYITPILSIPRVQLNRTIIQRTVFYWKSHNMDFIDAYLAAYIEEYDLEGIYSYDDTDFDKIKSIRRLEP